MDANCRTRRKLCKLFGVSMSISTDTFVDEKISDIQHLSPHFTHVAVFGGKYLLNKKAT